MASKKTKTYPTKLTNQPDLSNDFYLLHLDNQKLAKEVQDLKQITQSLMLTINRLLNEQNHKEQFNQQTSSQEMQRQITQIEWNLRQNFDQRISQLEQIKLNQCSNPESRGVRNPSLSYQKIERRCQYCKKYGWKVNKCYRFKSKQYQETKRGIQNLFKIYCTPNGIQYQKKRFQPYQEAPKITDALRRYER